ncbi:MAG: hypothetical protein FJ382_06660 [Verrucomicrobia bacterium]|nr:hypothetical protein [Verrucomicrobiota bacterium]
MQKTPLTCVSTGRSFRFLRPGLVSAWIALLVMCTPGLAQADAQALKEKDEQIAKLLAEVERLRAALGQSRAEAAAPVASAAPAATAPAGSGVAAPRSGPESSADDRSTDAYRMSAFEVRTTQGTGYSAGNSASALKTSESLMRLPAQIIVLTSDMVKDIGSNNASDVLAFAGVVPFFRGPAIMSRGQRIGNPYTDDVPQSSGIGISDNTYIDTYQVIKGPQQVLYPLASLGGLVLQTTKKPLPDITHYRVDTKVQQWGRQRTTFDFNRPIGNLGEAKITARVVGVVQSGQGPLKNSKDDREGIFPSLSLDWKNTHVVVQYGALHFKYLPGGTGILTPDGGIYTGMGHRNQGSPRNNDDDDTQDDARLSWTQVLSDDWQVRSQVTWFNVFRYGSTAFPTGVNWNTNKVTYTVRRNNGTQENLNFQTDVSGRYKLLGRNATSAFGFNHDDQKGRSAFWIGTPITLNIGDAAAIDAIQLPSVYDYRPPANPGSRFRRYVTNGYYMQTFDVIPDRLTLAGGLTFSHIENVQNTNLALRNPYTSTNSAATELLHRMAAVYRVRDDLSLYASQSTTFNPAVGVQYDNTPLPSVLGECNEVGIKTSFFDGKLSGSLALYKMELTNQAILAAFPALNVAGLNYFIPIGSTNSEGWDASFALTPLPGLQMVATAYSGTVEDQNGSKITGTVDRSWSVFGRYDFRPDSGVKGLHFGGGANKAGGKWFTMSGMTLPGGVPLPVTKSGTSVFQLKQEVLLNLFVGYEFNKHWTGRIDVVNALDKAFAVGAQGVGLADIVDPRTFSLQVSYSH